jgi:hypothetical protein
MCNNYFFHYNNGYANAPYCYVIRTLPVLLVSILTTKFDNNPSCWECADGRTDTRGEANVRLSHLHYGRAYYVACRNAMDEKKCALRLPAISF